MDYKRFYATLFAPLTRSIGPIDKHTIFAIMGFDGGGPLNFSTIGCDTGTRQITYISCELAVRNTQIPTKHGGFRYELLSSCDDEEWVRKILSNVGHMSMEIAFDDGHTIDIGPIVNLHDDEPPPIQAVLIQQECTTEFEGDRYGVLRCVGITRPELELVRQHGVSRLVQKLKKAGIWPHTFVQRKSVC